MAHIVKCVKCGQQFDRDKIQAIQIGRRYAHLNCENAIIQQTEIDKETQDLNNLRDCIQDIFGKDARWSLIMEQIKKYKEEKNYTYTGMMKSLIYFYKVKGNEVNAETGGVGIIPLYYDEARNYYLNIWLINQKNAEKNINDYIPKDITITIPNPQYPKKKKKIFMFLDEEGD